MGAAGAPRAGGGERPPVEGASAEAAGVGEARREAGARAAAESGPQRESAPAASLP
jgi:hypothetical protein